MPFFFLDEQKAFQSRPVRDCDFPSLLRPLRCLTLQLLRALPREVFPKPSYGPAGLVTDFSMIELRGVSFSFPSSRQSSGPALSGINLHIPQGSYAAVMGPNGSGKSTLGKLIKGLLSPTTGEVRIRGIPLKPQEISARVGYIFSNPENQIISSVVEEDVAFGLENMGLEPAEIARQVQQSLAWVGMEEYRYHAPHLLSGGQQQKVVLAGILAMGSEILVLDEPTSMLDLQDRREILDLLHKLHSQGNKTILHITHSFEEALRARVLIILSQGRVRFSDSVTDCLGGERWLEDSGITFPPLQQLIRDLRAHGYAVPPETASVQELKSCLLGLKGGRL